MALQIKVRRVLQDGPHCPTISGYHSCTVQFGGTSPTHRGSGATSLTCADLLDEAGPGSVQPSSVPIRLRVRRIHARRHSNSLEEIFRNPTPAWFITHGASSNYSIHTSLNTHPDPRGYFDKHWTEPASRAVQYHTFSEVKRASEYCP